MGLSPERHGGAEGRGVPGHPSIQERRDRQLRRRLLPGEPEAHVRCHPGGGPQVDEGQRAVRLAHLRQRRVREQLADRRLTWWFDGVRPVRTPGSAGRYLGHHLRFRPLDALRRAGARRRPPRRRRARRVAERGRRGRRCGHLRADARLAHRRRHCRHSKRLGERHGGCARQPQRARHGHRGHRRRRACRGQRPDRRPVRQQLADGAHRHRRNRAAGRHEDRRHHDGHAYGDRLRGGHRDRRRGRRGRGRGRARQRRHDRLDR